ncbi:MAG: transporter substrate-binding domain-containing protein [Lachnospiraceae bacterium]|nr:transporter substrate-binding domain-containing protein [Lachnospiraceae bacterium]
MKKRIISLILTGIMSFSLLAGCTKTAGSGSKGTSGSIAAVKKLSDGTYEVTVAVLDGMAPYTYTDEKGKMQGYDYEWMKAVDEKLKDYKFKYVSVSADAAPAAIQAGTYAFSCSAHFVTPARKKNFILGIPDAYYPVNLISKKEDSFKKFEDLDNKSLVPNPPNDGLSVVLSDMHQKYPDVKYTQDPTSEYIPYLDGLNDVISGKYDCWFGGETMYNDLVKSDSSLASKTFCSDPVTTAPCVPVFNKSLTDLREAVNEATVELYKDGTLKNLSDKWLGKDYIQVAKDTGSLFDYDGYSKDKADWYND